MIACYSEIYLNKTINFRLLPIIGPTLPLIIMSVYDTSFPHRWCNG